MNKNKIGTVFLISILALAGVGVSFSGLTDIISVWGIAKTGTVDLVVEYYSGTWVFKIIEIPVGTSPLGSPDKYDPELEILIYKGNASDLNQYPGESAIWQWAESYGGNATLISWAQGRAWQEGIDPYKDEATQTPYDAVVEFHNLFPCIEFKADLDLHYRGTIPAKVISYPITFNGVITKLPDGTEGDWLKYLQQKGLFKINLGASAIPQLHYCQHLYFNVSIHLPQDNLFQGLTGNLYLTINLQQWNDECDETTGDKVLNLPDPKSYVAFCDLQTTSIYGSYFDAILTGIPIGNPPYNVWDDRWPCWCIDEYTGYKDGYVELWDTYDPFMPEPPEPNSWDPGDWNCVNWIVNNANPTNYPGIVMMDIQQAIWFFIDGGFLPPPGPGRDLAQDAASHTDFIPQEGQLCCVLLWPVVGPHPNHSFRDDQITFIVVDP